MAKYAADGVKSSGKTFSSSNQSVQLELFQLCTLKNYVSTRDRVVWRGAYGHAVTGRLETAMLSRRFFFCAPRMGRASDGYILLWNRDRRLLVFPIYSAVSVLGYARVVWWLCPLVALVAA